MLKNCLKYIYLALIPLLTAGCADEVNNNRIPAMPVDINLANPGLWATYGISGVNTFQYFIRDAGIPAGFYYLETTYTGFGGVLLYGVGSTAAFPGTDTSQAWPYTPVAFDMACPVEVKPDIVVYVDDMRMEAVCPVCGSRYSLEAGGSPVAGPAVGMKYGLQQYRCIGDPLNGYRIVR